MRPQAPATQRRSGAALTGPRPNALRSAASSCATARATASASTSSGGRSRMVLTPPGRTRRSFSWQQRTTWSRALGVFQVEGGAQSRGRALRSPLDCWPPGPRAGAAGRRPSTPALASSPSSRMISMMRTLRTMSARLPSKVLEMRDGTWNTEATSSSRRPAGDAARPAPFCRTPGGRARRRGAATSTSVRSRRSRSAPRRR